MVALLNARSRRDCVTRLCPSLMHQHNVRTDGGAGGSVIVCPGPFRVHLQYLPQSLVRDMTDEALK